MVYKSTTNPSQDKLTPTTTQVWFSTATTKIRNTDNTSSTARDAPIPSKDQLPLNFNLNNTEETTVDEQTAPAVVHEHIRPERHEIVTEVITRDIHQDHYFNYILPVKEVVIKPAVHYTLNDKGEKVRLPGTPDCWEVPPGFTPTRDDERVSAITPPAVAEPVATSRSSRYSDSS